MALGCEVGLDEFVKRTDDDGRSVRQAFASQRDKDRRKAAVCSQRCENCAELIGRIR